MTQATCGSTVLCPILWINHRLTILICLNVFTLLLFTYIKCSNQYSFIPSNEKRMAFYKPEASLSSSEPISNACRRLFWSSWLSEIGERISFSGHKDIKPASVVLLENCPQISFKKLFSFPVLSCGSVQSAIFINISGSSHQSSEKMQPSFISQMQ